jgi:ferritin-like metal-binding protein YciE
MMAGPQTLKTHLVTELKDLLDAEQQLTKVLPDFARRATTPGLRIAFEQHLSETQNQIHRLRKALEQLGESPAKKRCEGMRGLIREANAVVSTTPEGPLRDAVMITSAQKVEHYEMASYGTARTYAQVLGEPQVARLLQDTLAEEKHADAKLTEIAEGKVNDKAAEAWHQATEGVLEQTAVFAGKSGRYKRTDDQTCGDRGQLRTLSASQQASGRRPGNIVVEPGSRNGERNGHECGGSSCVASARSHK